MNTYLSNRFSSLRIQTDGDAIITRFVEHIKYNLGKDQFTATPYDCYIAFASVIRDHIIQNWLLTQQDQYAHPAKRVYFLSLEYLIGRSLTNAILNLDLEKTVIKELQNMGYHLEMLAELEWDAGLGNGGLGRLAACFLDSMSTLKIPAFGYGIRYEYGIFFQHIQQGKQLETPDNWLRYGSAWEIPHQEHLFPVHFGGEVQQHYDDQYRLQVIWHPADNVMAMAYDYLIPGYQNGFVNTLRLWAAKASREFNLDYFNEGDYIRAVAGKSNTETISKVLYPKDDTWAGKELRFKQEYFFVSATLQDILRRFAKTEHDFRLIPEKAAIQLNDTHPAIAVADLMRILVDEKQLPWNTAWEITQNTIAYTNHTILPEALEKWQVSMFEAVLPRHLQIIYEINKRFLNQISLLGTFGQEELTQLSIIEEEPVRQVRMANLSIIGSHSINGVSALHSEILKTEVFPLFYRYKPEMFNNKTNGITPRRWLRLANPSLSALITELIGEAWISDLDELTRLRDFAADKVVIDKWRQIKQASKVHFADHLRKLEYGVIDPESIFDFQAKRIHEYKRQLLNALHIISWALKIKAEPGFRPHPHTFFFAGKAAPGYALAKLIIRFINAIAVWIDQDPILAKYLKVVFLSNYRVTLAERIMPAAELSQQISTAGTEASGTGNMKFSLNGALTIGTLDGANIEILQEVGAANFFLFGMTAQEVSQLKATGYNSQDFVESAPYLQDVLQLINSDALSPAEPGLYKPILEALFNFGDRYCIIADFASYASAMQRVNDVYQDTQLWNAMSILNVAGMGKFSSDNTIRQYANEIWNVVSSSH